LLYTDWETMYQGRTSHGDEVITPGNPTARRETQNKLSAVTWNGDDDEEEDEAEDENGGAGDRASCRKERSAANGKDVQESSEYVLFR
jgi:hypothetical protein